MAPDLAVEVKQGVEHGRQAARAGLVVARQRGHETVAATLHQPAHDLAQLRTRCINSIQLIQRLCRATLEHMIEQLVEQARVRNPQQRARAIQRDRTRRQRHQLVEQPDRVTHRSLRRARDQLHRLRIDRHLFGRCNVREPRDDLLFAVAPEHELLAAADHGQRNLLSICGAQHEHDVRRRLLERLQQRVERRLREHVRLVDDVDLEWPHGRGEVHLLSKVANLIDSSVGRGVDLDEVEGRARCHLHARLALVARLGGIAGTARAVQRFGKQPRG